jgi:hypothetical protein
MSGNVIAEKKAEFAVELTNPAGGTGAPNRVNDMKETRAKTRAITHAPQRGGAGRWLPGSPSPNPAGRPSIPADVKEAARAHTLAAIETLARVMGDESAPPAAQVTAACALLDRGWGKPVAHVEAKVATLDLGRAHLEALQKLSQGRT